MSFKSDTFFRLSFCAVSLNASNDSSEPYTVIPIVVALYRGSIFKLCVFLWCIFQNIREGCKVAIIYYFFTKSFTQTVYDSVKHVGLRYWLCFMFSFVLSSFLLDFFDASFRIIPEKKKKMLNRICLSSSGYWLDMNKLWNWCVKWTKVQVLDREGPSTAKVNRIHAQMAGMLL